METGNKLKYEISNNQLTKYLANKPCTYPKFSLQKVFLFIFCREIIILFENNDLIWLA